MKARDDVSEIMVLGALSMGRQACTIGSIWDHHHSME